MSWTQKKGYNPSKGLRSSNILTVWEKKMPQNKKPAVYNHLLAYVVFFNHTLLRTLHAKILSTNLMFNNLSQCQIQIHLAFSKQFEVAAASRHCFGLQSVGELKFYQPRFKPHSTH